MTTGRRPHGETRRKILDTLRRRGLLSAAELADELGVGTVAVRQHLGLLQQEGLVSLGGARHGAGRPRQLYALTEAAERLFPHAYERLALDLLICVGQQEGAPVDQLFAARQELLARRYAPELAGLPLEQQAERLASMLSEQGYMAEVRACDDGIELVQHNCPIAQVAAAYEQACSCERALYEQLLGVRVVSAGTIAGGERCCRYEISAQEAEPWSKPAQEPPAGFA